MKSKPKEKKPILCSMGFHSWNKVRVMMEERRICSRCKTKQLYINSRWQTVESFVFGSHTWDK